MFFTVIVVGIVSFFFFRLWIQRRKLPPGPFPLPLIGNMHQLGYKVFIKKKNFIDAVREWAKEYGTVHTFWMGPMATVNICDYSTAVDAMVKKGSAFADRTVPYLFELTRSGRGILIANGSPWLEQRRFALHTLRNFGLGRNVIEERIMYEFEIACEALNTRLEAEGKSIDAHRNFELLIANIINRMLFTERFEKKDEEKFFALKREMDETLKKFVLFDMLIDEWNVNWPFLKQRRDYQLKPLEPIKDFIRSQIEQRKHEIANGIHVPQGEGDDFVDAFLIQMKKDRESGAPTSFDEEILVISLLDLWSAGQETTATTLEWAFSYLLLNPKVIARVEEELLSLTKGRRPLSIVDRPNTPFYNATLTEVHRCATLLPMNMWRDTAQDTVVGPYVIPKGTAITAQISLIMTDEKYFKNCYEFNPDRYFSGNKLEQKVVAFGLGKRSCLGESLAQAELYLIIGNLLLRYKISADPLHMPCMTATDETGKMRTPRSYHIHFERR